MKLGYVFLIAVLAFGAGIFVAAVVIGVPLSFQLIEARAELALARAEAEEAQLSQDELVEQLGGNRQVYVLYPKQPIGQWSTIREPAEMFDLEATPRRLVEPGAIVLEEREKIDTLKGRRLRATVEPGQMLTEDHLLKKELNDIDAMLEKGKRAVSIPITRDGGGFFIVPGTRVDVVHSVEGKPSVLLENVLVLAIDINPKADPNTATLQIDNTEQVLKLTAARDKGTLSLVLRAPMDDDKKVDQ
jgi:Flp pilus assembly protein CpaB